MFMVVFLLCWLAVSSMVVFSVEKWMAFSRRFDRAARSKVSSPRMVMEGGVLILNFMLLDSRRCVWLWLRRLASASMLMGVCLMSCDWASRLDSLRSPSMMRWDRLVSFWMLVRNFSRCWAGIFSWRSSDDARMAASGDLSSWVKIWV